MPDRSDVSMKMTDSPGAMLVMPFRVAAPTKDCESSSVFQPVIFTAVARVFVTSNQSAATGLFPLDQGATSEINSLPVAPGEPVSVLLAERNAPLLPATLKVEMVGSGRVTLPRPALLSNVTPAVAEPKLTPVMRVPAESKRFTASPALLRPTPEPP